MGDGLPFIMAMNQTYGGGFLAETTLAWKYAPGGCAAVKQNSLDLAAGKYDTQLDELAAVIRSTSPGFNWLLRVEYEVSASRTFMREGNEPG